MAHTKRITSVTLEHIQPSNRLVDQTYEILRQAIISWRIRPGERLYQLELASKIGVSQMIVREAFSRLEAEGLVVREPYKGTRATPFTTRDLEDLYRIRLLLEGDAFELAAASISAGELATLRSMLPQVVFNPEAPDSLDRTLWQHREFHFIIYHAGGYKYLARFLSQVWNLVDPYLLYSPHLIQSMTREELFQSVQTDLVSHSLLIEALETRDGAKARAASDAHILAGLESLEEAIQSAAGYPTP